MASKDGPSLCDRNEGRGYFASAILNSFDERPRFRPLRTADEPFTLEDFKVVIVETVQKYSGKRQYADGYFPAGLPTRFTFFEPLEAKLQLTGNAGPAESGKLPIP